MEAGSSYILYMPTHGLLARFCGGSPAGGSIKPGSGCGSRRTLLWVTVAVNCTSCPLERTPASHSGQVAGCRLQGCSMQGRKAAGCKAAVRKAAGVLLGSTPKNDSQNESPLCVAGMRSWVTCPDAGLNDRHNGSTALVVRHGGDSLYKIYSDGTSTVRRTAKQQAYWQAERPSGTKEVAPKRGPVPWCRSACPLASCFAVRRTADVPSLEIQTVW